MKALVHGGGGSKGAWGAGVLQHLLGDKQTRYDLVCGVSVGAINGAFVSQFEAGAEKLCAETLKELWLTLDTSKIYKRWAPFGRFHAMWQKSFYDSSPLHLLLRSNIHLDKIRFAGKKVCVGAVSVNSGKYTIFDQDSEHFVDAVIASASFPGMLEPVEFLDQLWVDGGVKEISPLRTAIEHGATEIDVIMTSPLTRTRKFIAKPNTIDVLKRAIDLSSDKIMSNDIDKAQMYNKLALRGDLDKREVKLNIIRPQFNLIEDLLDFDPVKIRQMLELGYQDAKRSVE